MAITLRQTPRGLINQANNVNAYVDLPLFTANPCVFVVFESSIGTYKFAYTCQVEWKYPEEAAYTTIATLRVSENQARCGVFDLSAILTSLGRVVFQQHKPNPSLFGTAQLIRYTNSYGTVQLTFGSEQAVSATDPPTPNASTVVSVHNCISGSTVGSDHELTTTSGIYGSVDELEAFTTPYDMNRLESRIQTASYLTGYITNAAQESAPQFYVSSGQYVCQTWVLGADTVATTPASKLVVTLYNGSSTLGTNTFDAPTPVPLNQTAASFVCPLWMKAQSWPIDTRLFTAAGNPKTWTHYTIQWKNVLSLDRGVVHTYYLTDKCKGNTGLEFSFINRHGGQDFLTTTGKTRLKQSVKRSEFRRSFGNWNTATGLTVDNTSVLDNQGQWGYQRTARGLVSLPLSTEQEYTVNTGPLNEYENAVFIAMMQSNAVYAFYVDGKRDEFQPIVIRTDSIRFLSSNNADFVEYEFDMVYAKQVPTQALGSIIDADTSLI